MSLPLATNQLLKERDCVAAAEQGSAEPGTILYDGNTDVRGLLMLGK